MCLGGNQPSAPEVKYVGPSEDDIRRNEEALVQYQTDIAAHQAEFQNTLQAQIDQAAADTEALKTRYAADLAAAQEESAAGISSAEAAGARDVAAAGADSAAKQVGAYTIAATKSEPLKEETTAAVTKKKKPKKNLKISTAGTASGVGSGLNIGI